jgi:hypothetical protein
MKQILSDKTAHPISVYEDEECYLVETTLLPTFYYSPPSTLFVHRIVNGTIFILLASLIIFIFIKVGNYDHYYAEFLFFAGLPILVISSVTLSLFKKPTETYNKYNASKVFDLTHHNNKIISFFMHKKSKELKIYISKNLFRNINMEEGNLFIYAKEPYHDRAIHYRGGINNTLVKFTLSVIPRKIRGDAQQEMDALIPILNHVHALTFTTKNTYSDASNDSTVMQDQASQKKINPMD